MSFVKLYIMLFYFVPAHGNSNKRYSTRKFYLKKKERKTGVRLCNSKKKKKYTLKLHYAQLLCSVWKSVCICSGLSMENGHLVGQPGYRDTLIIMH